MVNFVCVFRYISILSHHKQNLVVFGIGALCHDDVKCWSPSSTSTYSKTIFPKLLDIRCVCYNWLICAKIFHKKHSKPKPFIACKGIYSSWLLPFLFDKSKERAIVSTNPPSDRRSWFVKNGGRETCREVAIMHALRSVNSFWVEHVAADELRVMNRVRRIRWKWESHLNFLRCKWVQ